MIASTKADCTSVAALSTRSKGRARKTPCGSCLRLVPAHEKLSNSNNDLNAHFSKEAGARFKAAARRFDSECREAMCNGKVPMGTAEALVERFDFLQPFLNHLSPGTKMQYLA